MVQLMLQKHSLIESIDQLVKVFLLTNQLNCFEGFIASSELYPLLNNNVIGAMCVCVCVRLRF